MMQYGEPKTVLRTSVSFIWDARKHHSDNPVLGKRFELRDILMGDTKALDRTSRIPGGDRKFYRCLQIVLNPSSFQSEVMNVISREVKRLERESYHSHSSNSEVYSGRTFTSVLRMTFTDHIISGLESLVRGESVGYGMKLHHM
jgi:hypothetical protein